MTAATQEEFVPASDAATALRVSREQVVRRIQRGELAGEQLHGRWFIYRSALERAAADVGLTRS